MSVIFVKKNYLQSVNAELSTGYTIFPLGDSAATIDLGNTINDLLNDKVIAMQQWMLVNPFAGQKDIIVAYSSLTIIYDPFVIMRHFKPPATVFEWVKDRLTMAFNQSTGQPRPTGSSGRAINQLTVVRIPVCYDDAYAMDLQAMAIAKNMRPEEIIELHTARTYRVYTIGFLPGFSYMAEVDKKLVTPRKSNPVQVAAGSVGIAGAQTGIYPLDSPGGWHIIGRTPVKQFDAASKELVKLHVGDHVQFYSITQEEYNSSVINVQM